MRESVKADHPFVRKELPFDEARAIVEREGQDFKVEILDDLKAKAEARRRAPAGHDVLRARAVPRPVPGAARRVDREDRAVQAARGLRRLLARRPGARVDAAHLRHGLGVAGGARPVPVASRGGEEARPPPPGRAARPVQLPRRRARLGVLAPQGLAAVPDAPGRDARAPGAARVRGDLHAAARAPEAVGAVRALGAVPRQHVPGRRRGAVVQPQADELPRVVVRLPVAAAVVPRPAAAPVRVRRAAPQRAVGRAVRPHARAPLRHGRRPHLRATGPDRLGDRGADGRDPGGVRLVRPDADPHVRHAARQGARRPRRVGARPRRSCGPSSTAPASSTG